MSLKLASAENQYKKDPLLKKADVVQLQKWLEKQPHLPEISEIEIIFFLHSCYYSLERTKKTIDNFFSIKSAHPQVFGRNDRERFFPSLDQGIYAALPTLTPEDYQILFVKVLNVDPNSISYGNHLKYVLSTMHLHLMEKGVNNGVVLLCDLKNVTLNLVLKMPIHMIKAIFVFVQEALPTRLKAIHVINTPPVIDKIMLIVKPFLKTDLLNIIHFYTDDLHTLHKYVPLQCLPKDYGGSEIALTDLHKNTKMTILSNITLIEEDEMKFVDESKRQSKSKISGGTFGNEGSFKKLEID